MTDTFTESEPETPADENPNIRQLREKANRADEAERALADAQRQLAVMQAGVDPESPQGKLFLKAYDGEATTEAIKAAAQEYGVPLRGAETETVDEPTELPETGTEVRQALADQAPADTGESPDPRQVAKDNFEASLKNGAPEDQAIGDAIATLSRAAHEGDQRVIWEPGVR